jgi:hypothetical protein
VGGVEATAQITDERPAVAATPPRLADHVAALLGLDVFEAADAADGPSRPLLVVVTDATARSVVDDGLVAAMGSRLVGVVCWHVGADELPPLLEHLAEEGVPAFVGVPTPDELVQALAVTGRGIRYEEDIMIARAIARYEAELRECIHA